MLEKIVMLPPERVSEFVNRANACDFDIDIANENKRKSKIDAKSILGVMGLDLGQKLVVTYEGEDAAFEELLTELSAEK